MNLKNRNQTLRQANLIDGHVHLSDMAHPGRSVENTLTAGVNRMIAVVKVDPLKASSYHFISLII
jgi:hypothetical protein